MNIHPGAGGFVVAAGALLGVCAGLLWTAQGSLMMGYPTERMLFLHPVVKISAHAKLYRGEGKIYRYLLGYFQLGCCCRRFSKCFPGGIELETPAYLVHRSHWAPTLIQWYDNDPI